MNAFIYICNPLTFTNLELLAMIILRNFRIHAKLTLYQDVKIALTKSYIKPKLNI